MRNKLLEQIRDATDTGPLRQMFAECDVGRKLNHVRARMVPLEGEDGQAFHRRVQRKLRQLSLRDGCLSYESCISCREAQDILATTAAATYHCQPAHALTVLQQLGATGQRRTLPNACSIGRTVNRLLAEGDSEEHGEVAAAVVAEKYGCPDKVSCLHCGLGNGVASNLLLDLAERGMDGDAGKLLRDSHNLLFE